MIKNPFPDYVGFAVSTPENARGFILDPAENKLLSPRAVKKRRDEFFLGRAACRTAMKCIGIENPQPILKGASNEPIWPKGILGSISHCPGIAVCAVCRAEKLNGIGVDIEEIAGDIPKDVCRLVCTEKEIDWVGGEAYKMKMVFSAKEAAFKAFFPSVKKYMDFKDTELLWDERRAVFRGILLKEYEPFSKGYRFEAGCLINSRYILSYIMI